MMPVIPAIAFSFASVDSRTEITRAIPIRFGALSLIPLCLLAAFVLIGLIPLPASKIEIYDRGRPPEQSSIPLQQNPMIIPLHLALRRQIAMYLQNSYVSRLLVQIKNTQSGVECSAELEPSATSTCSLNPGNYRIETYEHSNSAIGDGSWFYLILDEFSKPALRSKFRGGVSRMPIVGTLQVELTTQSETTAPASPHKDNSGNRDLSRIAPK